MLPPSSDHRSYNKNVNKKKKYILYFTLGWFMDLQKIISVVFVVIGKFWSKLIEHIPEKKYNNTCFIYACEALFYPLEDSQFI